MTHTPGPWEVEKPETISRDILVYSEDHGEIATVDNETNGDYTAYTRKATESIAKETYANARLIAAAPDLLMALIAIGTRLKQKQGHHGRVISWDAILEICEAAIKQARP